MKRLTAIFLFILLMLSGCSEANSSINKAIVLRNELLKANNCSFVATITADYGDNAYIFKIRANVNTEGDLNFEVIEPETIYGIRGTISNEGGHITFDDHALMFEMLADGQITPVCAPWLFIRALRSGYIGACGKVADGLHIQIDDSFRGEALQVDIWADKDNKPLRCEFLWQGRRIVSIDVVDFLIV